MEIGEKNKNININFLKKGEIVFLLFFILILILIIFLYWFYSKDNLNILGNKFISSEAHARLITRAMYEDGLTDTERTELFKETIIEAEKKLIEIPDDKSANYNLFFSYYNLGYLDKAESVLKNYLEKVDYFDSKFNMYFSGILLENGKVEESERYRLRAIEIEPQFSFISPTKFILEVKILGVENEK
uniref:Tetratricopeptide repeat protein n=1 Tax=candidate division CPR3 bacterium TaxID=2268181 RepID=A0A7C4M0B1_UNCC3